MPREKSTRQPPKRLKQTKLTGGLQSSSARTEPSPSKAKSAAKRKHSSPPEETAIQSDDSGVGAIKLEPKKEEDSDNGLPTPAKRRRRTIVVGSDAEDSNEDTTTVKPKPIEEPRRTRNSKGKQPEVNIKDATKKKKGKEPVKGKGKGRISKSVASDSEAEDSPPPPRRRKLVKGTRPAPKTDSESDEVDEEHIIQQRFRSRDKKTAYQKGLEKLKQKKQGKHVESEEEDPEWYYVEEVVPFKGAAPDDGSESEHNSLFDEAESDASEGFIVEDNGEGLASLPAEFSMETHEDLAHQFKKIFQFFVHIAVHPPIERHEFMERLMKTEEYFAVPLTVARRKILGLRDSLVASSVWRPEFKGPLERYPELELVHLDFALPGCDACHLGARMSTVSGRLQGEPYDRLGFQDLDISDDDHVQTGETRAEFQLGRFCARRMRVYHDLSHWEYTLFKTISDEVDELHITEQKKGKQFVRVAWVGGTKPPEDLTDADGICDWLDQRKVIEVEWEKLKGYMESARGLELAAKKGDDVD